MMIAVVTSKSASNYVICWHWWSCFI